MTNIAFQPRQSCWEINDVISSGLKVLDLIFKLEPQLHGNFVTLLSRDVYSEGDSLPLYDYVMGRQNEMSSEFLSMMEPWLQDERKHYEALRRVYHAITDVGFKDMDDAFDERNHEIEPIMRILEDEFTILVALCFDELGSTYSYRRDLNEYYRHYGPEICRVGTLLVADEGIHFANALKILQLNHGHRLHEVEPLLREIDKLEKSLGRYCKTFFLDHAQEQFRFPENFNEIIIEIILAKLGRGEFPKQAKTLWSWKPQGFTLVPTAAPECGMRY